MIELHLTGKVGVAFTETDDGDTGSTTYHIDSTARAVYGIDATKEFPDGYVNLEGYVLSEYHTTEEDMLASFHILDHGAFEGADIDPVDLTVEMSGSRYDWVDQAVLYVTERPSRSVIDALELFRRWDETDTDTLNRAIQAAGHIDGTDRPSGGLADDEWNSMVSGLATLCEGMRRRNTDRLLIGE